MLGCRAARERYGKASGALHRLINELAETLRALTAEFSGVLTNDNFAFSHA